MNVGILGVKSPPVGEFQRLGLTAAISAASSDAFHMSVVILRSLGVPLPVTCNRAKSGGQCELLKFQELF